jgi:hypothetical protein
MITDPQPKTREEWFSLVDEQATSGLSQKEFCSQRNLILCRFSYYKTQRVSKKPQASFSPVKFHQATSISSVVKIDLPNGFCCHVPNTVSAENLKSIISVLMLC